MKVIKRPPLWFLLEHYNATNMVRVIKRTKDSAGLIGMLSLTVGEWVLVLGAYGKLPKRMALLFEIEEH